MSDLRKRLAAGDLDALDDPLLEWELLADLPSATPEHWWWEGAYECACGVYGRLADVVSTEGVSFPGWGSASFRDLACAEINLCGQLRALGPVGCERELRALATLERLCGLGGEA